MFYIVSFTGIFLLSAICICVPSLKRKSKVCVYFVMEVQVIQFFEKSAYDQHTCPIPQQEAISSTPVDLTPAALSFKNEMQIRVLWEFRTNQESQKAADREGWPTDLKISLLGASSVGGATQRHSSIDTSLPVEFCEDLWCCWLVMLRDSSFLTVGFCAFHLIDMW